MEITINERHLLDNVFLEEIRFHLTEKFVMHLQVLAYDFQCTLYGVHSIRVHCLSNVRTDPPHRLHNFFVVPKVTAGAFRRQDEPLERMWVNESLEFDLTSTACENTSL
jgi:hypothetical protein